MAAVQPVPAKRPFPLGAAPPADRPRTSADNEEEEESLPPEIMEKNQKLGLVRPSFVSLATRIDVQDMIRETIKTRTIYDALPVSFRLILLDTNLLVKKALHCLIQNSKPTLHSPKVQSVFLVITYQTSSQLRFGTLKNPLLQVSSPPRTLSTS